MIDKNKKCDYVSPKMNYLREIFQRYDNRYLVDVLGVSMDCVRQFKRGSSHEKKSSATQNLSLLNFHKAKKIFLNNAENDILKLK